MFVTRWQWQCAPRSPVDPGTAPRAAGYTGGNGRVRPFHALTLTLEFTSRAGARPRFTPRLWAGDAVP